MCIQIRQIGNGVIKKIKKDSLNLKKVKYAMCTPVGKLILDD